MSCKPTPLGNMWDIFGESGISHWSGSTISIRDPKLSLLIRGRNLRPSCNDLLATYIISVKTVKNFLRTINTLFKSCFTVFPFTPDDLFPFRSTHGKDCLEAFGNH